MIQNYGGEALNKVFWALSVPVTPYVTWDMLNWFLQHSYF